MNAETEITVIIGVDGSITIAADGYNAEDEVARVLAYLNQQGIDLTLEGDIRHTRREPEARRVSRQKQIGG